MSNAANILRLFNSVLIRDRLPVHAPKIRQYSPGIEIDVREGRMRLWPIHVDKNGFVPVLFYLWDGTN